MVNERSEIAKKDLPNSFHFGESDNCVSKKSCPSLYNESLYKYGKDLQYVREATKKVIFFVAWPLRKRTCFLAYVLQKKEKAKKVPLATKLEWRGVRP